jgi:hypothetical protein
MDNAIEAQLLPAGQGHGLEAGRVHGLGGHGQPVAGGGGLDHAGQQPARTSSGPRTPMRSSPGAPPCCPLPVSWPAGPVAA